MGELKTACMLLLLVCIGSVEAQEYKFGKVSKEELVEQSHPLDSSANAAVLYENKKISITYNSTNGFQLVTDVFKRVKLYTQEGFKYATDEMMLYKTKTDKEVVKGLKGVTYTLVDGKIATTKLKKEAVFKTEFSEIYNQQKFTMPALQEGSVIEYKYKIVSPFLSVIDRIYLQYDIPIKKIEVRVQSPEYFKYKKFSAGYLPINLKEFTVNDELTYKTETTILEGLEAGRVKSSSHDVDFVSTVNEIVSVQVPAFKKEPLSANIKNYISSLTYELSYVQLPNKPIEHRSTTWEDVTKKIYNNSNFGGELKKTGYYKEDIDQLVDGVSNPVKKASLIYNFVKQKMNWNNKRAVMASKGVKKAYKEGTGNVAEINLMLTSMLDYANIDANPVIASTGDRLNSLFPTLNGFNYVLTRVKLPDNTIFYLDATDKYGMPNVLCDRLIKGKGRVIAKNGTSQEVDFRPRKPSIGRYNVRCELDATEGIVKGVFNVRHMGYLAHRYRESCAELDQEHKIERVEKQYGISGVESYEVKGIREYGKGVSEVFKFAVEDQVEIIEDELFFSPLLFLRDKENIFKSDNRKYPIDFGFGFSNLYMVTIKVPEGYEVVEYPGNKAFKLPGNMGKFSLMSKVANGELQVIVNETITASVIPADNYLTIKEFYNQVIEKENEQVVLKKL